MGDIPELYDPLLAWAKKHLDVSKEDYNSGKKKLEIDISKVRVSTDRESVKFTEKRPKRSVPPSGVVFKSKYVNNTTIPQEHTFTMERTTEATVTTTLSKGFTKNGSVGIKLHVPDSVAILTGGFGSDVLIETEDENTVKHSMTWSINSKVNAPPEKTTVAELRITEKSSAFNFTANVVLKGRVLAKVTDTTTGRAKPAIGTLAEILSNTSYNGNFTNSNMSIEDKKVKWKVEGDLHFRFGVSQDVTVDYEQEDVASFSFNTGPIL